MLGESRRRVLEELHREQVEGLHDLQAWRVGLETLAERPSHRCIGEAVRNRAVVEVYEDLPVEVLQLGEERARHRISGRVQQHFCEIGRLFERAAPCSQADEGCDRR